MPAFLRRSRIGVARVARPFSSHVTRGLLAALVAGTSIFAACAQSFDTSRPAPPPTMTLGDDIYQVLCDRISATVDPFDLEARHSRGVCRPDASGAYANDYLDQDKADFPDHAMPAKMAVMVRYRKDLIAALNATLPDKDSLHGDLDDLLKAIVPLYDDDTLPESTRTLAAIMDTLSFGAKVAPAPDATNPASGPKARRGDDVRAALARLGGRKGYRTLTTAIGLARPVLAYPKMNDVVDTTIRLLGPGGAAEPELRKMLAIAQAEMETAAIPDARKPIPGYADRFANLPDGRPKILSEILRNFLIDPPPLTGDLTAPGYPAGWQDKFAATPDGSVAPVLPVLLRDARGYSAFAVVPDQARDSDGDGLPDTDAMGRFISKAGAPLALPTPFKIVRTPGTSPDSGARDALGRALTGPAGQSIYRYTDASRTVLAAVLRETKVIAAPANGALLDMTHAAQAQFGPRSPSSDPTDETSGKDVANYADPDGGGARAIKYRKFDADGSPMTDLVYATTRFLEFPKVDDYLDLTRQLMRDHPDKVARVLGAALAIRNLANKPEYAGVSLDAKSALWDDVLAVVQQMVAEPDLMSEVLLALGEDDTLLVQPAMAAFFGNIDALDYDPAADTCVLGADATCPALNNPVYDVSTGAPATKPSTPVDPTKADDANRSIFERFLSLMHDSHGVSSCNKQGAFINSKILGLNLSLPLFSSTGYDECAAINIPDLAEFYLGCVAGGTDEASGKARCNIHVSEGVVSALNSFGAGNILDSVLESTSGITGMKQTPTVEALNRLVMWREPNKFVNDLFAPMTTVVCPVTNPATNHRDCASPDDLLQNRQRATIFQGEVMSSLQGLAPTVRAFVKRRGADKTSRLPYFFGLIDAFYAHWGDGTNAFRCAGGTKIGDPKFCTGSNVRQFERLIAEALQTDLVPALNDFTKTLKTMKVHDLSGVDVMVAMTADLLGPTNSAGIGLTDRHGNVGTTRNDGGAIAQVTPFYLFADALNRMDTQWIGPGGDKKHTLWKQARSKLVDQFMTVDQDGGDPTKSHLHDSAIEAALPIAIDLLADRLAEHRAKGDLHTWATKTVVDNFKTSMSGPLFATSMDLMEKLYADKTARTTVGDLLVYLLNQASVNDALGTVVTSAQDFLQVIGDDENMVPIYHALATAMAPDGATKRSLDLIEKIRNIETSTDWVTAHAGRRALPRVLANAVTPMSVGGPAPIEIFIDLVADLQRTDPAAGGAFAADDYGAVAWNVEDFLTSTTRGLEQLYAIVKHRNLP